MQSFQNVANPARERKLETLDDFSIDVDLSGKIKAMLDLIALSFWTDTTPCRHHDDGEYQQPLHLWISWAERRNALHVPLRSKSGDFTRVQ